MSEYLDRVARKFNADQVPRFALPTARREFLGPVDAAMDWASTEPLSPEQTTSCFKALHYIKYKLHEALGDKARGRVYRWKLWYVRVRNRIMNGHMGLVEDGVRYMQKRRQVRDVSDTKARCRIALMRVVDGFDPWRGWKFSTYAYGSILKEFGRVKRLSDLSVADPATLLIPDGRDPEADLYADRLRHILRFNKANLTRNELRVIRHRFGVGIHGCRARRETETLGKVGLRLGVSDQTVHNIQKQAIQKLREAMKADPILNSA